mmetsp:Transcript_7195/g.30649  ORF Transcript_7195/g.30649 Transcript_7195/m.30649 type:complete len:245 (+) Transcript_7195:694-1428(+)
MHSKRVGDLNLVFVSSAYLGLTNSSIEPPVFSSCALYSGSDTMSWLMFPGNGEPPFSSFTSPSGLIVARSKGSSWLYSTFTVILRPSRCASSAMAPMASFALRGTHSELNWKPFSLDTPRAPGTTRNTSELVSWKNTIHFFPAAAHFFRRPLVCSSACTSPWPCGLVCNAYASSFASAKCASLFVRQGTFSCLMSVTCSGDAPKNALRSSKSNVLACVSSEVMMASGISFPSPARACSARMECT